MAIFEVLNNQQSYFNRYFRRNEGTTDYATHSSVTVDRIVMNVNPSAGNGNTGLPIGAPAVTDNVMQTIDFVYSGTISELYRNGSDYFSGIIANVKYYLSGELIHSWSINSNSSTESDSVGGLLLTFINPNASDWGLFDRQVNGDWLGQELVVNGGFDSDLSGWSIQSGGTGDGTLNWEGGAISYTTDSTYRYGGAFQLQSVINGGLYFASFECTNFVGVGVVRLGFDQAATMVSASQTGLHQGEIKGSTSQKLFLNNFDSLVSFKADNVSVKEVLKNA